MNDITLIHSTGEAKADAILQGAIGILETIFPQRIGGYYLVGSYEDSSHVPTSDLDIVPIFKGSMTKEEETLYWQVIHNLDLISPIHLGFGLRNEEDSYTQGGVGIKIGSKLLYGEDVRDKIPLWSFDFYMQYMITSHLNMILSLRKMEKLTFPLDYPDSNGKFYGYDQYDENAQEVRTNALFGHVMVMASTMVTLKTGEYNASKSRSFEFYRRHINDQWSDFLENFYEKCKMAWHYRIPASPADQEALRRLCEQVLPFENHFVEQIKPYLRTQLNQGNPWAVEQSGRMMFPE